jgi:hypothetical protein
MSIFPASGGWLNLPREKVLPDWLSDPVTKLARLRNKLLHAGKKDLANEDIVGIILAVDEAIIWLFAPKRGSTKFDDRVWTLTPSASMPTNH